MRDFTKKISHKEMTLFLLPLFGVKLFEQIAGIVNVVVINRMLGQEIITCISACRIYPMLQNNLLGVAATGFGVYVTRMIGKKDRKEQQAAVAKVLSGTCILTLAGFLMLFFIEPLLTLTNVPESIRAHAREYLFWLFAGSGALVFHNLFLSMLYGLGESAFAGGVSAAGVCLQPILTLLFVKHSGGMAGAVAQAQLVNRLILAAVLFGYLWWKYRYLFAEGLKPSADAKEWRELWSCGFSASVMLMIVWCGTFLIQRQVNRMPEVHISAYMYAIMVEDLILVPIWGCGEAASYILAQNAGAGKFSQVRHYYRRLNGLGGIFCLILIGVVWLSAPSLVRLVMGPASEEIYDCAIRWLHMMCFVFWEISAGEIGRSSLRAVGAYRSMQLLGILESVLRMVMGLFVISGTDFNTLIGSFFAIFVIMGTAFLICNGMVLKKLVEEEKNGA